MSKSLGEKLQDSSLGERLRSSSLGERLQDSSLGERLQFSRRGRWGQPRSPLDMLPSRRRWDPVREWAGILVVAILMSLIVKTFFVQPFFIPSGSMEPTLHGCTACPGDRVLVNKQTNHMGGLQRGDVVVFHDSAGWIRQPASTVGLAGRLHNALAFIGLVASDDESDLVKRVIGVAGDTVEGRANGKVYVNGTKLDEPYLFRGDRATDFRFKVTVPADRLWVMGDHRSDSSDSRFHRNGPGKGFVALEDVVGRAFVIAWPLDRAGLLGRPATFDQSGLTKKR